jgi:hypothetical protein
MAARTHMETAHRLENNLFRAAARKVTGMTRMGEGCSFTQEADGRLGAPPHTGRRLPHFPAGEAG